MKNMNETAMEGDNLTKYGESEHDYLGAPNASGYYSEKNASEISESTESNLTAGGGDEIIGNSTAIEEIDHAKLNDREDEFNTTGIHQHRNLWSSLVNFLYSRRQLAEISDNSMDEISLGITSGTLDEDDDEIPIPEFSTTSGDVLMNSTGTANAEERGQQPPNATSRGMLPRVGLKSSHVHSRNCGVTPIGNQSSLVWRANLPSSVCAL